MVILIENNTHFPLIFQDPGMPFDSMVLELSSPWGIASKSVEVPLVVCWVHIGDEILPSYVGVTR